MTTTDHLADARELVLRALDPKLTDTERSVRARTAGEHVTDLRDLIRWGSLITGGSTIDAVRDDGDAQRRAAARRILTELRATATPADLFYGNGVITPAEGTGIDRALYLIREWATPNPQNERLLIPALPTAIDGWVSVRLGTEPAAPTQPIQIDDSTNLTRFLASSWALFSMMLIDGLTDVGAAYLDRFMADVADRAAEKRDRAARRGAGRNRSRVQRHRDRAHHR